MTTAKPKTRKVKTRTLSPRPLSTSTGHRESKCPSGSQSNSSPRYCEPSSEHRSAEKKSLVCVASGIPVARRSISDFTNPPWKVSPLAHSSPGYIHPNCHQQTDSPEIVSKIRGPGLDKLFDRILVPDIHARACRRSITANASEILRRYRKDAERKAKLAMKAVDAPHKGSASGGAPSTRRQSRSSAGGKVSSVRK